MKNSGKKIGISLSACILMSVFLSAQAEEVRTQLICKKVKTCVVESLDDQEVQPQMKELITAQLDAQCSQTHVGKEDEIKKAGLVEQANACADELIAMPCQKLMTPNVAQNSKACVALEKAAEEAGIEIY